MTEFTKEQLERYNRHIVLKEFGIEGQSKIMNGKVLIIGTGGLGSAISFYLAAAGVGTIGIVDPDVVDRSNLQRQIIHFTSDLGCEKVISARQKMKALNPDIEVVVYKTRARAENAFTLIRDYDFVVDATDSFASKYLVNDACVLARKPFLHAGVLEFRGQVMTVIPGQTACLRCLLPKTPLPDSVPSSERVGILGSVAGMLGTIEATETLKFLAGVGTLLTNRMVIIDALEMSFRTVTLQKNKKCPLCGEQPSITELKDER